MDAPTPLGNDPARVAAQIGARLQEAARVLNQSFLDKQEIIRLLLISVIAGEHMLLVGPPGTAKSAIVRLFTRLIDARYFEYLLTRFTEPNELFGPVDIKQFREGHYTRRTERMLPEAEIVFLDEIFKSNSAILNSMLTILNERRFANGSNEVPNDENLAAIFDRFLIRAVSDNLDSYHFHALVQKGLGNEVAAITGKAPVTQPILRATDLHALHAGFDRYLVFTEDFLAKYKGLIFQIRSEGISVSDRRVVKLLKLFAASALFDGRTQAVDDAYYRDRPAERRFLGPQAGLEELLAELKMIRDLLTSGAELSDIQLFSQLKNLNEIKAALQAIGNDTARKMIAEVDKLLETVFASSKFGSGS
jgi:MoxR-like ATPase